MLRSFFPMLRRGARVDESTCLESMRLGNGTVGSNPTLSAKPSLLDPESYPNVMGDGMNTIVI